MDEGVQQNAALVEEAAAASQSIVHQVRDLNASVSSVETGVAVENPRATARPARAEPAVWRKSA
jgi:hypothetical protein